ncbi:uncharacterized protein EI97DRAFT_452788 [Westerdykella ornata]|uniref:Uncharacterized protein n=1 Tax=Westerdykella ornata TaxID=318751 RepID=A0A6A6J8K6_WESOR|nr:uncharacterized protein EI97DRAFT_452788 [Westerdykella ornata]KAF2272705.1 hypothetical protein EI97DRAFT_452788 [Westerdykella ornata]
MHASPPSSYTTLSGPGLVVMFGTVTPDCPVSEETLNEWLDEEYIPRLLATHALRSAARYKAANPHFSRQIMIIYQVTNLSLLNDPKVKNVPRTSKRFPTDDPIETWVPFEIRVYSWVQIYTRQVYPDDAATKIIYTAIEPGEGEEEELDAWYREEYNQQMSEQPGWIRTSRWRHRYTRLSSGEMVQRPSILALHEFAEGEQLGRNVEPLQPITNWTRRVMAHAKEIDAAIFIKPSATDKAMPPHPSPVQSRS